MALSLEILDVSVTLEFINHLQFDNISVPEGLFECVMGLCSAFRPNNEPLRGSAQDVPDSMTSVVGKAGG